MPLDLSRLTLILTAACNLGCAYCYQNAKRPRRMTWETLLAALDLLREERAREVRVLFTGGEPLLEYELIERAVSYLDVMRAPDVRVRDRVAIAIEGDVGLLARPDGLDQRGLEGMRGQGQEDALLLGEHGRDSLVALIRMQYLIQGRQ